jgi:predicted PurR-regulated permease PerM
MEFLLPGRPKRGAAVFLVIALTIILVPSWLLLDSVIESVAGFGQRLSSGELKLPAPDPRVGEWPLIGKRLLQGWKDAVETPHAVVERLMPQIRPAGRWLVESIGQLVSELGKSLIAIVIATLFLANAEACNRGLTRVIDRLAPERGARYTDLAAATVRSVVQGVLGIALLQSLMAAVGLILAGVPAAGLWSALVLAMAVMQLPPLVVLAPAAIWVFSVKGSFTGALFLIWSVLVSASDGFLKPLVLGRGVGVPTLVILLGAIGGMIANGIVGLFVGAVVLAIGYELGGAWLAEATVAGPSPHDTQDDPNTKGMAHEQK